LIRAHDVNPFGDDINATQKNTETLIDASKEADLARSKDRKLC
jgi:hypothetical protein